MHAGSRMLHYACSSPMAAVPARPAAPRTGPAGSYATRPLSRSSSGAPQAATHVHTVAGRGTRCTGGRAAGSAATRAACLPRRVKITWQKVGHTDDTLHARWSGPQYHSATGQGNSRHPQQKLARVIPSPTAPTSHGARAPTSTLRMREATGCDPHQTPIERGQLRACQAAGHRPVLAGCRTVGQLRERSKELCSLTVCRSALTPSHTICHLHTRCSCTVSWGRAVCSAELTNRPKRSETAQTILQTLGRDNGQRQSVLLVREDQRRAAVRSAQQQAGVLWCQAFQGRQPQRTWQLGIQPPALRAGERLWAAASEAEVPPAMCGPTCNAHNATDGSCRSDTPPGALHGESCHCGLRVLPSQTPRVAEVGRDLWR